MATRETLPQEIVTAIDELEKVAERYGAACSSGVGAEAWVQKLKERRLVLQEAVRAYGARLYNGGIDMGLAQVSGPLGLTQK